MISIDISSTVLPIDTSPWLTHFPTLNSVRITSSDCTADLPTVLLPRLHRLFHFRLVLSTRVPTVLFT